MHDKDKIVLVYTGNEVIIERIKVNLEKEDIFPVIKDEYHSGIKAGFVSGTPSTIDLYVIESDAEKAMKIVKDIVEE
jgi:hypothetical protein